MSAPTAATLRAVARRAERLADDIRALAELLAADPDLATQADGLPEAAEAIHEAAVGVLAAADALPRRRPRPRPAPTQTAGSVSGNTDPAASPASQPALPAVRRNGHDVLAGVAPKAAGPAVNPFPPVAGPAPISTAHPAPAAAVAAMVEATVAPLTPWQRQLLETVFTAAGPAPRALEPRPYTVVCPPPVLPSRGRAALASLQALAERAAYTAGFAAGRVIRWLCRRLPALPECAGLEWR